MSVEAMKAVWDHSESRGGPRLVLLALANRADEHGIAWPGLDELQRKAAMSRRAVQNALRSLEAADELRVVANVAGGRGKAPLRWISLPDLDGDLKGAEQRLGKGAVTDEKGRSSLPGKGADIDAPYIENSQKEPLGKRQAPLSHLLADLVEANGSKRPFVGRRWKDAERRMLELDNRDRTQAEGLIRWCQADEFWQGVVLSMPTFREKYDQLRLQAKRNGEPVPTQPRSVRA